MLDELAEKPIIEKLRYVIPAGDGLRWEIDEFLGVNQGLVVAEIELPSEESWFQILSSLSLTRFSSSTSSSSLSTKYESLHLLVQKILERGALILWRLQVMSHCLTRYSFPEAG